MICQPKFVQISHQNSRSQKYKVGYSHLCISSTPANIPHMASPVTSPTSPVEHHLPITLRSISSLAFVHRDEEAVAIAAANLRNKYPGATTGDYTLVTAGQLNGAGKSQMGLHAVECIREKPELRERLFAQGFSTKAVADYASAETVVVDLRMHEPDGIFPTYLSHALYTSLRNTSSSPTVRSWPALAQQDFRYTSVEVVWSYIESANRSLFIHWDQVSNPV